MDIFVKIILKTPFKMLTSFWYLYINFEQISQIPLLFPLLTYIYIPATSPFILMLYGVLLYGNITLTREFGTAKICR